MIFWIGENALLPIPRRDGKTSIFDEAAKLFGIAENALPKRIDGLA